MKRIGSAVRTLVRIGVREFGPYGLAFLAALAVAAIVLSLGGAS